MADLDKEFQDLIKRTVSELNSQASDPKNHMSYLSSDKTEELIAKTLIKKAKDTPFDEQIELIAGQAFPDIVVGKTYGIEVKSTKEDRWTIPGNSIFQRTRIPGVKTIYVIFAKWGGQIQFAAEPYDKCVSGIKITHSPRYYINMQLDENSNLFSRMGISYTDFAGLSQEKQVALIAKDAKAHLQESETLWWAGGLEENTSDIKLKNLRNLSKKEQEALIADGLVLFPEIFGKTSSKYDRFSNWLIITHSVVSNNTRDNFSAGGKKEIALPSGNKVLVSALLRRVSELSHSIRNSLANMSENVLKEQWNCQTIQSDRLEQWLSLVKKYCSTEDAATISTIFRS